MVHAGTSLKNIIHQSYSIANQSVVREAIQAVANTFANCIHDHFEEKITQKVSWSTAVALPILTVGAKRQTRLEMKKRLELMLGSKYDVIS